MSFGSIGQALTLILELAPRLERVVNDLEQIAHSHQSLLGKIESSVEDLFGIQSAPQAAAGPFPEPVPGVPVTGDEPDQGPTPVPPEGQPTAAAQPPDQAAIPPSGPVPPASGPGPVPGAPA